MLFVFDWDGTLLDSTDKIAGCMQKAIAELGLPERSTEQAKSIIGLGLPEAVQTLFPEIDKAIIPEVTAAYSRHFVADDQTPCDFFPNVDDVLKQLRAEGHLLAVATGKSRRGLNRVLANMSLTDFFDGSRCADETASKPDPLMLNQLLQELDVEVSSAVMVGDTDFDLGMAANAGMRSIGVSYGAHSVERLLPHKPVRIIDRFEELLEWG
ncbi:HAD-IA family hydrolase [Oceanicoccus sagamiensis]|uniref:HAD family hydrolase n=1 Tax=Oceanicoccus sagamiensis TaxID=716816 RepID=A0A1X9NBX9_9GAMM|nr:HAD-IA family hydrolase [Oceanicoccus sagamiensis]ARN75530.1 HAD family hydrolase [Oceanicoccus sagamiensis]